MSEPKSVKPPDLSKEYGAPFAIISRKEGFRYISLTNRGINPQLFLDFQLIGRHTNPIATYCRALSLEKFVKMRHHGYPQLMLEFYTTLSFTDDGFQCRLMGKSVTVTLKKLCDIFGFSEEGHTTVPEDFDPSEFWRKISGEGDFKSGMSAINSIKDPALHLMYMYISQGVLGKSKQALVVVKELFCLWCAYTDVPVCIPSFVLDTFKYVITNKRAKICLGNFITAIALHFGAFDPLDLDMLVFSTRAVRMRQYLVSYKCDKLATKDASSDGDDDGEDSNPVADDDHPWMLISHKLEQMHTQMNSGFHAMEARFDGLEKKVNAMCVPFKSFEHEMKDLGKVESNGAKTVEEMKLKNVEANKYIEKLRLEKLKSDEAAEMYKAKLDILLPRFKKIQEGLTKISSMKVVDVANLVNDLRGLATFEVGENLGFPYSRGKNDNLKNMIMPEVNAQEVAVLLHGVREISTASGNRNKGLPNNGDGNSPQPRTSENDNAHSVKKSLGSVANTSGTLIISGEVRSCKTTLSPSAAAGDTIIEIHDSDNETKPNRAVETSKRAMSSDKSENETNFVRLSKRNRTEKMEKSSPFSNTEQKKDALTHEKGKDDFSEDSDDESLSDSRMEDLIASLRRQCKNG